MNIIYPASAIIAQLLILGIERVSYRHIHAIEERLGLILPEEYYIDVSIVYKDDSSVIYRPNSLERPEVYDVFVRGWCSKSKAEILKILEESLRFSLYCEQLVEKLAELDLEKIHRQVFTQKYIEKHMFWDVPKEYRAQFKQIIADYVASLTPEPVPST